MTQIFNKEGQCFPVTLVEVEPGCVLERLSCNGKDRVRIGCFELGEKKISKVKKPQLGYFKKMGTPLFRFIKETEIDEDQNTDKQDAEAAEKKNKEDKKEADKQGVDKQEVKDTEKQEEEGKKTAEKDVVNKDKKELLYFGIEMFEVGQKVTVRAKTKGKGFAGAIKRHKTHRQPSSHGSGMHRRTGSIGASATPSRVMKNKKMPGHFGATYSVMKNLEILRIDKESKVLFIKGSIPGSRQGIINIIKQKTA